MRRFVLIVLAALCVSAWGTAIFLFTRSSQGKVVVVPTLMVLPSLTPSAVPTSSHIPTITPSDTPDATASPNAIPSATPTLAERLLIVSGVMSGVSITQMPTVPARETIIPAPPNPVEPLIDATNNAPPFMGWFSFESDYPTIHYDPPWTPRLAPDASRGQYHRTDSANWDGDLCF